LNTQLLQWALWGTSVLTGVGVIVAVLKLRFLQRYVPTAEQARVLEARLPVLQEELRQVGETIQAKRQEWAKLESEVGDLAKLIEWEKQNPDAQARIAQRLTDLERANPTSLPSRRRSVKKKPIGTK